MIAAPAAVAVLPDPSVTVTDVVIVPSAKVERLTVPTLASAVIDAVVESVNVTIASLGATSISIPATLNATASEASIVVSGMERARLVASPSAVVSNNTP